MFCAVGMLVVFQNESGEGKSYPDRLMCLVDKNIVFVFLPTLDLKGCLHCGSIFETMFLVDKDSVPHQRRTRWNEHSASPHHAIL